MKKIFKVLAVIALVAVIGFSFVACDDDSGGGQTPGGGITSSTPTAPKITTSSLPSGSKGLVYSQTLTATGAMPITWNKETGELPDGLTLSDEGVISGIPTTTGSSAFTVRATNALGSDTQPLSISVFISPDYITSIEDFATYLASLPNSYRINVKLYLSDLGVHQDGVGSSDGKTGSIRDVIFYYSNNAQQKKHVSSLDLSGSTFTEIKTFDFALCEDIESVIIGDSVTSIEYKAFDQCTSLKSVTIGNNVTSLSGFSWCTSLTSITIPDSVIEIEGEAFEQCTSLKNVTIGNNVTSLSGFSSCTSLTSITIPNSVTEIGYKAFAQCTSLKSVTIPKSVKTIGWYAFDKCTSLTSVTFETGSNIPNIDGFGTYVFPEGSSGNGGNTLKNAYNTGKAGTYTRTSSYGSTWTKQQ